MQKWSAESSSLDLVVFKVVRQVLASVAAVNQRRSYSWIPLFDMVESLPLAHSFWDSAIRLVLFQFCFYILPLRCFLSVKEEQGQRSHRSRQELPLDRLLIGVAAAEADFYIFVFRARWRGPTVISAGDYGQPYVKSLWTICLSLWWTIPFSGHHGFFSSWNKV